jgi:hypothetical protein
MGGADQPAAGSDGATVIGRGAGIAGDAGSDGGTCGAIGGAAAAASAGICSTEPQRGHFPRRPACSSPNRKRVPHAQVTSTMVKND